MFCRSNPLRLSIEIDHRGRKRETPRDSRGAGAHAEQPSGLTILDRDFLDTRAARLDAPTREESAVHALATIPALGWPVIRSPKHVDALDAGSACWIVHGRESTRPCVSAAAY
jgi:hypothetical protein